MTTINRTAILAGRKLDSAAILVYPNPQALHVFEQLGVETRSRLGAPSDPQRRMALVEGAVERVVEAQGKRV